MGLRKLRGRYPLSCRFLPLACPPTRRCSANVPSRAVSSPRQHFFVCPLPLGQPSLHQLPVLPGGVSSLSAAPLSLVPVRFSTVQLVPLGPAVSFVWQEEEASLAAAAELLPFLTGASLEPGGYFKRTDGLPPGSVHEGQHGQGSGLLSAADSCHRQT